MSNKAGRPMYERPLAKNLSALGVSGDPLGACWSGTTPFSGCKAGDIYSTQNCSPGTYPTVGADCAGGNGPAGGCFSGTNPGGYRCTAVGSTAQMSCFVGTTA